jgi:glycine dehydrogenase subunit 1
MHPQSRETLRTLAHGFGSEVVEVGLRDGVTDLDAWAEAIDDETSAVFFQAPNFLGAVEDADALAAAAKNSPAVVVGSYDPITLGILKPPGESGVDVCVGEGQPLGNRLDFGGPSFGFFAATEAYLRRMPGRIAGETRDVDGRRGFVLTLQTREQHIRREKATSNICTSQALNALAGVVYLVWLGRRGIVELGELLLQRTHYAREALTALDGVRALHEQPVIREFALTLDAPVEKVIARCQAEGVNPGYAVGRDYDEHPNALLVALTERRSRADIDRLADALGRAVAAERAGTPVEVGA